MVTDTYDPLGMEFDAGGHLNVDALNYRFQETLSSGWLHSCAWAYAQIGEAFDRASAQQDRARDVFTVHDTVHCRSVLVLLAELLMKADRQWMRRREEVEDLVLGAIVHDIGMALGDRDHHGASGADWVTTRLAEVVHDPRRRKRVAACCSHHPSSADLRDLGDPGLAELVALVRLADALHVGPYRAPTDVYNLIWDEGSPTGDLSRFYWTLNRTVKVHAAGLNARSHKIEVEPSYPDEELLCVPEFMRAHMQRELDSIVPHAPGWFRCRQVRFDPMMEDPAAWAGWEGRVLHAAAVLYCKRSLESPSSGALVDHLLQAVRLLSRPEFMGSAQREVDKIIDVVVDGDSGRPQLASLRRLAWLVDSRQRASLECPLTLGERGRVFGSLRDAATAGVAAHASRLPEVGSGEPLLLFGFGNPVSKLLEGLPDDGPCRVIYTPLARPVGDGDKVQLLEWAQGRPGLNVTVVPDEQLAWALERSAAVVMGCEALGSEGDEEFVLNSSGCLMVAALARHLGKPVYVLTDSMKLPLPGSVEPPMEMRGELFAHDGYSRKVVGQAKYPIAERLPLSLVTAVVTEYGVFPAPNVVEALAERAGGPEAEGGWPACLQPSISTTP